MGGRSASIAAALGAASPLPSPVDLVELPFMRTALAELLLLAVAGGLIGTWIVLHGLAFFSHAVGAAAFPGLVVANAAGFSPKLAGLAVALGYAGGVGAAQTGGAGRGAGRRGAGDRDSGAATALLLVFALGGGVILASDVLDSGAAVDRLLFGTLLGLDAGDLAFSGVAAALALGGTLLLGRAWTATGFDPEAAHSLGLPARAVEALLLLVVAAAAVAALPAVGALLVGAIFVLPAATARLLSRDIPKLMLWAIALAAAEGVAGLYAALWLDVSPGPAVATVGAAAYAIVALLAAILNRRARSRGAPAVSPRVEALE